jgi:hypothetical protein
VVRTRREVVGIVEHAAATDVHMIAAIETRRRAESGKRARDTQAFASARKKRYGHPPPQLSS